MAYTRFCLKLNFRRALLKKINFIQPMSFIFFVFLKFVHITNKWKHLNQNIPEEFWDKGKPFIWVHWHGQSLMLPKLWNYKNAPRERVPR